MTPSIMDCDHQPQGSQPEERTAINVTIRTNLKARFDFFIAWLKRYHGDEETIWTQNTAMDEILDHTWLWVAFLRTEGYKI